MPAKPNKDTPLLTRDQILDRLRALSNPENVAGMSRFGIQSDHVYGVSMPDLRRLAREAGKSHELARQLWQINSRETRILASLVDVPKQVTAAQMEAWAAEFDNWETCDQVVSNLFQQTPFAYEKARAWSEREEEYVKRAGFVLMARLAVKDKKATDADLAQFLPIIEREANDSRAMVKKGVNWALRQIGKRNLALNEAAIGCATRILKQDNRHGNWVGGDALSELTSEAVQARLQPRTATRQENR